MKEIRERAHTSVSEQASEFDHSSAPQFLAYYARVSQSDEAIARFSNILDRALDLLAEEGRTKEKFDVIDIGCGAGEQSLLWAERGHRVAALDVNEPLVCLGQQRAEKRGLKIRFDVGTATQLPYEDESADVVLLPELLEHVADWKACLSEAARVLRPAGLMYLSTSNKLCPVQQEFNLPLYSWYPGAVKRWCERRAVTTHPQWANHARYPAVNWFTYYGLSRWLGGKGIRTLDRFDVLAKQQLSSPARLLLVIIRGAAPLRFLAHVATEGTTVWGLKRAHA